LYDLKRPLCSRLFPEDETIDMMPVLKKSKEMAKQLREKGITPNFRRPTNPSFSSHRGGGGGRGGMNNHMDRRPPLRGGHNKRVFMTKRLNNGPLNKKPMYNRMIPMKGHPGNRFGGSTTAAAEAYVADYMRTMQHQLPPMPYAPPHDFPGFGSSIPPALPRYYDGIPARAPIIPDYPPPALPGRNHPSTSNYDKRSYDEFLWKNKNRNGPPRRDGRGESTRGGDKHRSYRR
jgi:YTH domain-containing protein 1